MLHTHATQGKTWELPRIRGHKIEVSPFFLIICGLFVLIGLNSYTNFLHQLMWAPVLFFSILLHELGHAAATKHHGFGTSRIVLHGMGGVAISKRGHTSPKQGMSISLAGPAVTAALAIVFGIIYLLVGPLLASTGNYALSVVLFFIQLMAVANLFLLILNLLPVFPLDGGQTLMHFLRRKSSEVAALEKALKVSLGTIAVVGVLVLLLFPGSGIFILFIFAMLGYSNWKTLEQIKTAGGRPIRFQ